jgi:hypothetical protein
MARKPPVKVKVRVMPKKAAREERLSPKARREEARKKGARHEKR